MCLFQALWLMAKTGMDCDMLGLQLGLYRGREAAQCSPDHLAVLANLCPRIARCVLYCKLRFFKELDKYINNVFQVGAGSLLVGVAGGAQQVPPHLPPLSRPPSLGAEP